MIKLTRTILTESTAVIADDIIDSSNLSAEVKSALKAHDWSRAYDARVSDAEGNAIVDLFLKHFDKFKDYQDKIKGIKEPLTRQIRNMKGEGFDDATNPFLEFLENYLQNNSLSEDNFIELNNMWSNGIISDNMLKEKDLSKNILLNSDLYNKQDKQFIVQAFSYLSDKKNIDKNIDLQRLLNKAELEDSDYIKYRDSVIYNNGKINDAQTIKVKLSEDERNNPIAKENDKNKLVNPVQYDTQTVDSIFKQGRERLNKDSVNILLNYLKDAGYINF